MDLKPTPVPELMVLRHFILCQSVDTEAEQIELRYGGDCSVEEIASKTPKDQPCYNFFLFKHTHEGDYLESIGKYTLIHGSSTALNLGENSYAICKVVELKLIT